MITKRKISVFVNMIPKSIWLNEFSKDYSDANIFEPDNLECFANNELVKLFSFQGSTLCLLGAYDIDVGKDKISLKIVGYFRPLVKNFKIGVTLFDEYFTFIDEVFVGVPVEGKFIIEKEISLNILGRQKDRTFSFTPVPIFSKNCSDTNTCFDEGGNEELFYGTNRIRTGSTDLNNYYGNDKDELEVGKCIVSIPPKKISGELKRPRKILFFQRKENPEKDIVLTSINPMDETEFYKWLNENIKKTDNRNSALIFIHGFNVSFAEAAWRTGQIAHDLPFNDGMTGFFSWPSAGNAKDYFRDIDQAESSVTNLAKFIEDLVNKGNVNQLHFIAHSMGNLVLTKSLNKLAAKESFNDKIKVIDQIVLAAPDISKQVFNEEIYPVFKTIGKRRTLYASDGDKALKLSKFLRSDLSRLGEGGENIYIVDGIDTVDASNIPIDGFKHSYIFETEQCLSDVHQLVIHNDPPKNRRLLSKVKEKLEYWFFREQMQY